MKEREEHEMLSNVPVTKEMYMTSRYDPIQTALLIIFRPILPTRSFINEYQGICLFPGIPLKRLPTLHDAVFSFHLTNLVYRT
jgi:hypothetical protein